MLFGGSDEGPQGSRWLIHGPLPHVKWVEKRKVFFGSLERVLLVLTLLESGSGKEACFGGKYCCYGGPRWGIYGPLPWVRWVERRKGAFGSSERELLVLNPLESS